MFLLTMGYLRAMGGITMGTLGKALVQMRHTSLLFYVL